MKKIILLFYACALISCRKNSEAINNEDLTNVKWIPETAVLDRPLPINGGLTTDYIAINGPNSYSEHPRCGLLGSVVYFQSQIKIG